MTDIASNSLHFDGSELRQPWQEPAIILERPLEVAAQVRPPGGPPGGAPYGFLGPLSGSQIMESGCL